jgi:class 3 adenylate cyclase
LPFFELRIGIHTGPVIAGVVGRKKFAYDIWGDTVNTAARLEQESEPGKINISGATHAFVQQRFNCTHRGKIVAKHKGEIDMYFVEEEKTELQ